MAREARLDIGLRELTDRARQEAVRDDRRRAEDRQVLDELTSTFEGTLVSCAEAQHVVTCLTRNGTNARGVIEIVGTDAFVIATGGTRTIVAKQALSALRTDRRPELNARTPSETVAWSDLLEHVLAVGDRVGLVLMGGHTVSGAVRHIGADQLMLRLDGDGDSLTVPFSSIDEVSRPTTKESS